MTWVAKTSGPTPATGWRGAGRVGNYVYICGGLQPFGGSATDAHRRYDLDADSWSTVAAMTSPRFNHAIEALGDFVYVAGGASNGDVSTTFERYDPATDTWVAKAALPASRQGGTLVALDSYLYFIGGLDLFDSVADVYRYDPALDSWTTMTSLPVARDRTAAAAGDGKINVLSGQETTATDSFRNDEYDPSVGVGGTWTNRAACPNRGDQGGAAEYLEGLVYLRAGNDAAHRLTHAYDRTSNTWTEKAIGVNPSDPLGSVKRDQFMWAFGGGTNGEIVVEMYDASATLEGWGMLI